MPPLSEREREEFLKDSSWVAKLGTLSKDGWPYVTPVWYEWDGHDFWVIGKPLAEFVDNVKRDPRVYLLVDKAEFPYVRMNIMGTAEVVSETWEQAWIDMSARMTKRYVGEAGLQYLDARLKYDLSVIRITPKKMNTWKVTGFPPDRTFTQPPLWKEVE